MKKRTLALLLACMLIVGVAAGGTIAWLTDKTNEVVNTFTVGNITLDIWEHPLKEDGTLDTSDAVAHVKTNDYHFVPGDTLPKDPWIVVEQGSEACYLFVKVEEVNNSVVATDAYEGVSQIILYRVDTVDTGENSGIWTPVMIGAEAKTGYYYCEISAEEAKSGTIKSILAPQNTFDAWAGQDNVMISEDITKAMVSAIDAARPQLKFTAAAVQKANVADVATAWEQLPDEFTEN